MTKPSDIDPSRCPLCGKPNDCAIANQQQGHPCWCREASFPQTLLDKVRPAAKNRACICKRCAQPHTPSTTD